MVIYGIRFMLHGLTYYCWKLISVLKVWFYLLSCYLLFLLLFISAENYRMGTFQFVLTSYSRIKISELCCVN
ncbi:hypothetical protein RchiOBHm_Chr2g0087041 [Rosa chinensis]|uniref:Uncharacterized protein n=1 Tax=Rosa chinensis TaxID=74649 RepID=A0A2P6RII8_ROSCH|nr:hypothetical protein RchiOBHm_Chr2g0087041 [Rosa chinensis]